MIVPFKRNYESMSLSDWVISHPGEEDLRATFLNMDRALKYIHDHGYCIQVFHPTAIEVLNNDEDYIQFKYLMELPSDPISRKKMIKEDIFNSSLIQIGLYSNSLKYLTPEFLKEKFDDFVQFLPASDVPYYRGVILRGASVYFSEFALEKRNRDLQELEKQLEEEGEKTDDNLLVDNTPPSNDRINDNIYKQINGIKDSAFISTLAIPTLVLIVAIIIMVFVWIISIV